MRARYVSTSTRVRVGAYGHACAPVRTSQCQMELFLLTTAAGGAKWGGGGRKKLAVRGYMRVGRGGANGGAERITCAVACAV